MISLTFILFQVTNMYLMVLDLVKYSCLLSVGARHLHTHPVGGSGSFSHLNRRRRLVAVEAEVHVVVQCSAL